MLSIFKRFRFRRTVRDLRSPLWHIRLDAAKSLAESGNSRAFDPLLAQLKVEQTSDVLCAIADALGKFGCAHAFEPLVDLLTGDSPPKSDYHSVMPGHAPQANEDWEELRYTWQRSAAWALGSLGDLRAVLPLIEALSHPSGEVRSAAAASLGKLGDRRAVQALIRALDDKYWMVRLHAAEALGTIGDARAIVPLQAAAFCDRGGLGGGQVSSAAKDGLKKLEQKGVNPLPPSDKGSTGSSGLVTALIGKLGSGDPSLSAHSMRVLGKQGDARAVRPLIQKLVAEESYERLAAAEALEHLGQPEWINCIRGNKGDFDRLGSTGDIRAVDPLIDALNSEFPDVRRNAATVLGRLGQSRAIEPLIQLVADQETVRKAAAEALNMLGQPEWKRIVQGNNGDFPNLARSGKACAFDLLLRAMRSSSESDRGDAARGLGLLGDFRAYGPLVEVLNTGPIGPSSEAAKALGQLGNRRAVEVLLQTFEETKDLQLRASIAEALGRLGDIRAVEPLFQFLCDEDQLPTAYDCLGAERGAMFATVTALSQLGDQRILDCGWEHRVKNWYEPDIAERKAACERVRKNKSLHESAGPSREK